METTSNPSTGSNRDWYETVRRVSEGDRLAFLELSRLVTGFLASWRAFDFRDDWDDLVQEVVMAAVEGLREGRIEKPAATVGYMRTTARFKYTDRLRRHDREFDGDIDDDRTAGGLALASAAEASTASPAADGRIDVRWALLQLPERTRQAVIEVYVMGKTYEEAARDTGIPLGSLKRFLRNGVAALTLRLEREAA
jgi:RNA polymerase sigma-70 factor (ECF subfamily)